MMAYLDEPNIQPDARIRLERADPHGGLTVRVNGQLRVGVSAFAAQAVLRGSRLIDIVAAGREVGGCPDEGGFC